MNIILKPLGIKQSIDIRLKSINLSINSSLTNAHAHYLSLLLSLCLFVCIYLSIYHSAPCINKILSSKF